ncbi:MAG: ECF transporter S component [Eubacteriales bacterium]
MQNNKSRALIRRISLSAMFLAFAVVSKMLISINIPVFGAGGMKVGLSGVFTFFPAALFGPLYGGIVSCLSDVLGYVFKPDGAYIPWLSLAAFAGGFIKGLIWIIITKTANKKNIIRAVTAVLLVCAGGYGITAHAALYADGVNSTFIASQQQLPTRGQTERLALSPVSSGIIELVKYNNDVITFTALSPESGYSVTIPSNAEIDGYSRPITKIGANAFSDCSELNTLTIPSVVKTIDADAFAGLNASKINIFAADGSAAQSYAEENGMTFTAVDDSDIEQITLNLDSDNLTDGEFTVRSSDTYRKYLSGYINFMTAGLESVMLLGLLFIAIDIMIERGRKKDAAKPKHSGYFLKIFLSIFGSGLIVTTINTEILRVFLAAWNGREFWILWVPRAVEEMLVCLFQAYVISILYGVYLTRIQKHTDK